MTDLVAWRIWAHPVRKRYAEALQFLLDEPVPIVYDTVPEPSRDPQQRWRVCVRVLQEAAAEGKPYVGWIQDDALVCKDFTAAVDRALTAAGSPILFSPYTGTGRPDQKGIRRAIRDAELRGDHWLTTRSLNWGVAVVFPAQYVRTVVELGSRSVYAKSPSDYRVGVALRDRCNLRTYYSHPSLAQHRDMRSLVGNDTGLQRVAHEFLGAKTSGLGIDFGRLPPACTREDGSLDPNLARVSAASGRQLPRKRNRTVV